MVPSSQRTSGIHPAPQPGSSKQGERDPPETKRNTRETGNDSDAKGQLVTVLAVAAFGALTVVALVVGFSRYCLEPDALLCDALRRSPPWLLLAGIAASPSVLLTWHWRERGRRANESHRHNELEQAAERLELDRTRNADLQREANRTHRLEAQSRISSNFAAAAHLLAAQESAAQLAGIHSLWEIARTSRAQRRNVLNLLAGFVRAKCPLNPLVAPPHLVSVAAAIRVLGQREWRDKWQLSEPVDLRSSYLLNYDFDDLHLPQARFDFSILQGARFRRANLVSATFCQAQCTNAIFADANLSNADFNLATITGVDLTTANTDGTKLAAARR